MVQRGVINRLILIVAVLVVASSMPLYSQNPGTAQTSESALSWAHKEYDRSLPKYDSIPMKHRLYFTSGVTIADGWRSEYGSRIGWRAGVGYRLTPVHSIETQITYYSGMSQSGKISGVNYSSADDERVSIDLGYGMSISNFGARGFHKGRCEVLYTAGATVSDGSSPLSLYNGIRANYSIFRNMSLYVEPRIRAYVSDVSTSMNRLSMSLTAGATFTLYEPEFYMHEVLTPLALRTNLLFDLVGAFNFGVEAPIGKRYSIVVDAMFPWYASKEKHLSYRLHNYAVEGRYWFGSREKRASRPYLTGLFAGLNIGGGKFDLMSHEESGYQGSFTSAGLSFGYVRPLSTNLRLEYSATMSMVQTSYYKYYWDGFSYTLKTPRSLKWESTYFMPTDISVALIWILDFNPNK